ncbi:hypothetical protein GGQ54_003347 [Naumannella cuiyingiana]|uniref:DUF8175 domain-containing protein n=1 Tax=Naumannella cuiyingiana TaxID=1347891 RepID=A0A7Z0DCC9_9ACTN|nr:hypothetical protein [Naumannella cuiyingiana]NYI72733.1 hypothetical protein [Naumannella cuiyingiana]
MAEDAGQERPSRWDGRVLTWGLSAIVVAGVVAMALVLGLTRSTSPAATSSAAAGSPAAVPVPAGTVPPAGASAGCPDLSVDTGVPSDVAWVDWDGALLPVSPTGGPARRNGDGFGICYAPGQGGAILAAAHAATAISLEPDRSWAARFVQQRVTAGPRREVMIAELEQSPPGTGAGQIAGYRVVSTRDTAAIVAIYLAFDDATGHTELTVSLVRDGGDWYVDGTQGVAVASASTTTFTRWGPA